MRIIAAVMSSGVASVLREKGQSFEVAAEHAVKMYRAILEALERDDFSRSLGSPPSLAPETSGGIGSETSGTTSRAPAEPPRDNLDAAEAGMSELLTRFESLGENCEFGLVQRRCGADPLGLLRFASAPLNSIIAALEARFDGLGASDTVDVELSANGREYIVADRRFGFRYHAWVAVGEMLPEEIKERESRRLSRLIQKLVEDLTDGRKLLVVHGMGTPLHRPDVDRLLESCRRYGPNTVFWVELADSVRPAGTVEWAGVDLLRGYIDRFAPGENAHDLSLDCWITICHEAERLWSEGKRSTELLSTSASSLPVQPSSHTGGVSIEDVVALIDEQAERAAPRPADRLVG